MDYRAEIRQTSPEATEAIAHLAEDTTVTCNARAKLHNIVRENIPAHGGGGGEMIFGRSKT